MRSFVSRWLCLQSHQACHKPTIFACNGSRCHMICFHSISTDKKKATDLRKLPIFPFAQSLYNVPSSKASMTLRLRLHWIQTSYNPFPTPSLHQQQNSRSTNSPDPSSSRNPCTTSRPPRLRVRSQDLSFMHPVPLASYREMQDGPMRGYRDLSR